MYLNFFNKFYFNSNYLNKYNIFYKFKINRLITYKSNNAISISNFFFNTINLFFTNTLVRFLETLTGQKILIKITTLLNNSLNFNDKIQCAVWSQKLKFFKKAIGSGFNLTEALEIIFLTLKLKDIDLLSNWMTDCFQKINFWKFKFIFRFLNYVFRFFFITIFKTYKFKGIKFQLKGKISVAGNARTRTIRFVFGDISNATFDNKILYNLSLIRTFTGVQGLKIWIVF